MELNKLLIFIVLLNLSACSDGLQMPTASTIAIDAKDDDATILKKAAHVVPTDNQYRAFKDNFMAFVHFGPNTFTGKEWGNGFEDPKVFNPTDLDTDQWCRIFKEAGMTKVILTAKHHDGFCLWQSRYTKHGVMSSLWKNGKGDVFKQLVASAKKYGLKVGFYLSPADLYQIESPTGLYGNLSKPTLRTIPTPVAGRPFKNKTTFQFKVDDYNAYFMNQLFELLTEYGPIDELWFDGAHPKRKGGQTYDYTSWKKLIKTLAPKAVIFGRQDMRWCGNEGGYTRATEWNVIPYPKNPNEMVKFPDLMKEDLGSLKELRKAKFLHYQIPETDTSIRHGWFYRNDDEQQVRSAEDVFDIYERSTGGNAVLLLNVPPNRMGKIGSRDASVLKAVGKRIRATYGTDLFKNAKGKKAFFDDAESYAKVKNNEISFSTEQPVTINRVRIQEAIKTYGERVAKFSFKALINDKWETIGEATNIGYQRVLRFNTITAQEFKFHFEKTRALPIVIKNIKGFYDKTPPPVLSITRDRMGMVHIKAKKDFYWNNHGDQRTSFFDIHYTTDGSTPTVKSPVFKGKFLLTSGTINAFSTIGGQKSSTSTKTFGIVKKDWNIKSIPKSKAKKLQKAIDANERSYYKGALKHLIIKLKNQENIQAFTYTPPKQRGIGLMERGKISVSMNGKRWKTVGYFEFGNIANDPSQRIYTFKKATKARFIKISPTKITDNAKEVGIAEIGIR